MHKSEMINHRIQCNLRAFSKHMTFLSLHIFYLILIFMVKSKYYVVKTISNVTDVKKNGDVGYDYQEDQYLESEDVIEVLFEDEHLTTDH